MNQFGRPISKFSAARYRIWLRGQACSTDFAFESIAGSIHAKHPNPELNTAAKGCNRHIEVAKFIFKTLGGFWGRHWFT